MTIKLPRRLNVDGKWLKIRTDYRVILDIMEMLEDVTLLASIKMQAMLEILYEDEVPKGHEQSAIEQAIWYIDCGINWDKKENPKSIMKWTKDAPLIFPAINATVGKGDIRDEHMHWWTFFGYYMGMRDDTLFSAILHIRRKLAEGKRLTKEERKFYYKNRNLIDFESKKSDSDDDIEYFSNLLKQGGD